MKNWFSQDTLNSLILAITKLFEDNMTDDRLYFECLREAVQSMDELVKSNPGVMHTHYTGGYVREAVCVSCFRNMSRGARESLLDTLNTHRVLDMGHVNLLTTTAQELAPDYPQMYRHYILCRKVDMALRRRVFVKLKSLLKRFDHMLRNGVDLESVVQGVPRYAFGKEWVLEGCRVGASRARGYTQLKEDGLHSFRTLSEGEGYMGDYFESELSSTNHGLTRIFHQPYESPYREQYDFSVQCPFVCLLRSTKTKERRALHVPVNVLDLTLQVRDSYLEAISGRTTNYVFSYLGTHLPSLDMLGWCYRTATRGKPLSALFYAFHKMQEGSGSEATIRHLDTLCDRIRESFPTLPDELHEVRDLARMQDSRIVSPLMPLCVPPVVRGLRWITKGGKAYRSHAFVHDFYAVLRRTTDALMASHVLKQCSVDVDFIDSLTVEDL